MNKSQTYKKTYAYGGKVKNYLNRFGSKPKSEDSPKSVDLGKLKFKSKNEHNKTLHKVEITPKKKKLLEKSFPVQNYLSIFLGLAFVFLFFFTFSYTYFQSQREGVYFTETLKNNVIQSVKSINNTWQPDIPKYQERYTSFLLLGIDARSPIIQNGVLTDKKGFKDVNTDTMMQIVYDHQENNFFFISIPRDMGHEFVDECIMKYYDMHPRRSINHIYKFGYMGNCPGGGIEILKKYITDITGFPIDYYAVVDLNSFLDVIDIIGDTGEDGEKGLWIDVPETVDSWYPNQFNGYFNIRIEKGFQFLTSQEILYYSRVRIGSDDYHRARRQQIVISAVKDKLFTGSQFKDPVVVANFIQKFNGKMIFSQIGLDDVRAAISIYDKVSEARIYQIVLDNKLGGLNELLMAPSYSKDGNHHINGWYLIPTTWNDKSVADKFVYVRNYVKEFIERPEEHKNLGI